jgi:nitrogen-specific signal transduction histidine kinase
MVLISSGKPQSPRIRSILEKAGFRVQSAPLKPLLLKKGTTRLAKAGGAAVHIGEANGGLDETVLALLHHDLQIRRRAVSAILKACVNLSPGVQLAGLALYDSSRSACIKYQCVGSQAQRVPDRLPWSRYPLLRIAQEKRSAVYASGSTSLSQICPLPGKDCGGCLAIPLPARDPLAVLFLSHNRAAPLDLRGYNILISLAQAMETILENAVLQGRLAVSETRYRSILSAAPFLIALLDSGGTILEVNPKAIRELRRQGISVRKVIGINLLKNPGTPEEIRSLIMESLRTTEPVNREKISLSLPRGTEVFRVHAFSLRGRPAAAPELLVIGEMITNYQQVMDEAERTERLAAIGRVAASLAHEVNNPLQALRSHLELIRSYPLSDEEREQSFQILEREVERLDEITRRVLGFARPVPDILQPASLPGILEQALALSRNYLRNQRVEILTDFPPDLPPVQAAAGQLIQVFLNIILNAVHAMEGKGHLAIRIRPRGDRAEISFTNDGPPIPPEYLARIFDPFFTTRAEGTGLGLSISHAILQRHHGAIQAANLPHRKGVRFTIEIPFAPPIP